MTYPETVRRDDGEDRKYQSLAADRLDFLHTTRMLPCPYLPGQAERKVVAELTDGSAERDYCRMIRAGYRRSGIIAYRHACPACRACVPVRIPVAAFRPGKSLARVARANDDLKVRILPAKAREDHYELFRRYQAGRHGDGEMADMNRAEFAALVEETTITTRLAEFRTADGTPLAVALYDELGDALSAVYTFFDPDHPKRSLGSHMILWLAEHCRRADKRYLYLGYWIADCGKMAYKARFRPLESLENGVWRPLS
jgi:arginyl-tRNA--protein-N-Asp/Glu arginylyltransferase